MKRYIKYILIFIWFNCFSFGQNSNLDSLLSVYNNKAQSDTNRLKAIDNIVWSYINNNPDTATLLGEEEVLFAQTTGQKKYEAIALSTIGEAFKNKSNFTKSLECYLKSLRLSEEIGNKQGIATSYNGIGLVYYNQFNYPKALEYVFKALKLFQELGDKKGMGDSYRKLGTVYSGQGKTNESLGYFLKAFQQYEKVGDKKGIGTCLINIGNRYSELLNYPKSLEYYLKALIMQKEFNSMRGVAACYGNIGDLNNKFSNYKLTIAYCDSAIRLVKGKGIIQLEMDAYNNLAIAYSKLGNYKKAYENHVIFKQLTDSIFNADNSKQLGDMKTQFEVEKKEAELKIKSEAEHEKLKAISNEEKKRQQVIIYSVGGILFLVIIFSLFLFNRFRITQKQKHVIEEQKLLVDKAYEDLQEKNKEVMDSINYASRIQRALITSETYVANQLNRLMKN